MVPEAVTAPGTRGGGGRAATAGALAAAAETSRSSRMVGARLGQADERLLTVTAIVIMIHLSLVTTR